MFITLEGIDGSGKTTFGQILTEWLNNNGHPASFTREPYTQTVRDIVTGSYRLGDRAELMAFLFDRAVHIQDFIQPQLDAGIIVVCDRFYDSTMVYQGYGRGINLGQIAIANDLATGSLTPDLTIWLDVPVEMAKERCERRGKANHLDELGMQSREAYEAIAQNDPQRIVRVDARGDISEVMGRVVEVVRGLLSYHSTRPSTEPVSDSPACGIRPQSLPGGQG